MGKGGGIKNKGSQPFILRFIAHLRVSRRFKRHFASHSPILEGAHPILVGCNLAQVIIGAVRLAPSPGNASALLFV